MNLSAKIKNIFGVLNDAEKKTFKTLTALDIVISILDIFFLAVLLYVIRFYTDPKSKSALHFLPGAFTNRASLLLICSYFMLFSIKNFLGFTVMRHQQKFVYNVATRLSRQQLHHYQEGSYKDYVEVDSSAQIRKISQMPIEFGHYVVGGLQQIISQSVLILLTLIAIFTYNPVLLPLLFAVLGPPLFLTGYMMKNKLGRVRQLAKTTGEKALQHLKEALAAFIEGNIFGRKKFFLRRFESSQSAFNDMLSDQLVLQNAPSRLIEIFAMLGLLILICLDSLLSRDHSALEMTIAAFITAAYKIIPGAVRILNSAGQIKTYGFTIDALSEEKANPALTICPPGDQTIQCLAFHDVSFKYNGKPVIDNFSFHLLNGKFVGITGQSGKGKTTIINLLLGFLDTQGGSIQINEIPTTSQDRRSYWKRISYVKQEPFILHDTILNNITFEEEFHSTELLARAVKATSLEKMMEVPVDGSEWFLRENGKNISGGQRQRIAIARALYKDADLIILDEPFNELDRISENSLLNFFRDLARHGKIVVLITHNAESLAFCDNIISLDEK